jgi:hypothetical protein
VFVPKASCTSSDWKSACVAGRKKKTIVIASCGAISAYGSQRERKRARFFHGGLPKFGVRDDFSCDVTALGSVRRKVVSDPSFAALSTPRAPASSAGARDQAIDPC